MTDSTTAVNPRVPRRPSRYRAGERVGKYTLERELGRGGMGEVWEAVDASGGAVALKLMHADDAGSEERRSRFMREARLLASIQHPHVVKIRDVLTSRGGLVLVMERLFGEPLRRRVDRGPLGITETIALVEQLLDALTAIHEKGIVHRDLKPDNLFLIDTGDARVDLRVLDFGIASAERVGARTLTDLTQTGALIGTPAYMSPEQLFGEEADPRSDLWSVGILVHTCVTGKSPTEDVALGGVIKRVTKDPIPSLRARVHGPLADLVDAVLQKEREHRPPSARACLALLRGELSSGAGAIGGEARARPIAMRRSTTALTLAGIVGVLVVGVATLGPLGQRSPAPEPTPDGRSTPASASAPEAPPPAMSALAPLPSSFPAAAPWPSASANASARPDRHRRGGASAAAPAASSKATAAASTKPATTVPSVEDIVFEP